MAKGNLFQGMARGKVGDVVFYRMNGVQMSRIRNRDPKNPRSNEQLYQRAIIASVMKAYSAGKEIFDHSFQGFTVGEGCMRRFNSVNARILRSQVVEDINSGETYGGANVGRVVGPGSVCCTPIINLQISEGTLFNPLFQFVGRSPGESYSMQLQINAKAAGDTETTTVKALFDELGINPGDIFTFCMMVISDNTVVYRTPGITDGFGTQYDTRFEWIRLIVKDTIPTTPVGTTTLREIFNFEKGNEMASIDPLITLTASESEFISAKDGYKIATLGCIRSRMDVDLRSTEYMYCVTNDAWGIASIHLLKAWQFMVQKIGQSELILEGGDTSDGIKPLNAENEFIAPTAVNENPTPTPARHKGTRNNSR